jgi:Mor family transcriptional regulator
LPDKSELFEEWKNGKRIKDLAKKYGVSYNVIRRILIAYDRQAYKEIAKIKRTVRSRKKLSVTNSKLYEQWKNGMSTRALAKKYKVSRQSIRRRLKECNRREYKEIAQKKIADSIAKHRKKISVPPDKLMEQWLRGESTATLAREYHVSRQTIARILMKYGKDLYLKIVKERITNARTKELQIPIDELKKRWENGESPENLEKASGVNYRTILNKLAEYYKQQYKKIAEKRSGLGSFRARRLGADSLFELNVKRILEKYGFSTKKFILKLGHLPTRLPATRQ